MQIKYREKKITKITDLAGSWDVSDEELEKIKTAIKTVWQKTVFSTGKIIVDKLIFFEVV